MLSVVAGLALIPPALADQAPSQASQAGALKWRTRPTAAKPVTKSAFEVVSEAAAATTLKPADEAPEPTAKAVAAEPAPKPAKPMEVRRAAVNISYEQFSNKRSRAKVRNSIMQVSNEVLEPPKDPFEDSAAAKSDDETKAEPKAESATDPLDAPPASDSFGVQPDTSKRAEDELTAPPAAPESSDEAAPWRSGVTPSPSEPIPMPSDEPLDVLGPSSDGCESEVVDCKRAADTLLKRDIRTVVVALSISGVEGNDYPCECELAHETYRGRSFSPTTFTWKATGTWHHPLYFEDAQLERYGHSWNPVLQPFMSAAHFFVSIPLVPYKMGLNPPNECVYTLGFYRPGSCAPYVIDPIPLSLRGALFEAGAATAFAFWFFPPGVPSQ